MSDGNFNRALLPSTPYRSGVKMGFQQAKIKAKDVLTELLQERLPDINAKQRQDLVEEFANRLALQ